jgi:hypothetical protein
MTRGVKKQPVGLINSGGATLKQGLRRLGHDYQPSASPRLCANPWTLPDAQQTAGRRRHKPNQPDQNQLS